MKREESKVGFEAYEGEVRWWLRGRKTRAPVRLCISPPAKQTQISHGDHVRSPKFTRPPQAELEARATNRVQINGKEAELHRRLVRDEGIEWVLLAKEPRSETD